MKIKKLVIGAVLVIIGLPVLLVLIVIAYVSVVNRTNGAMVLVELGGEGSRRLTLAISPGGAWL